ncbi:MAG TPA: hypothetical protein VFV96_14470 [Verrucomicrobiae bacterium]|nr:hypothetical protein [Verrucomicrobiae bacterium]
MIAFLLICLFFAVALPSVPLLCAWHFNAGRIVTLIAGMISLALVAGITRYVVFMFGAGEGDTDFPILIGLVLSGGIVLCTLIMMTNGGRKRADK